MIQTRITAIGVAALIALAAGSTAAAVSAGPEGNEAAAAPSNVQTHTIVPGDTLARIAARYGVTVQAIAQANGIANPNLIYAGRTLTIPVGGAAPAVASGSQAAAAPSGVQTHTIVSGDTLGRIAARYGVTVQAIAQANGIANPNRIYAGRTLTIPVGGAAPAQTRPVAQPQPAAATSSTSSGAGTATAAYTSAGTLTRAGVEQAARAAGWPEGAIPTVVRVAQCESGLRSGAVGRAGEVGLMQIHPVHRGLHAKYNLYDPVQNLQAAREIHASSGWRAWACA